MKKAFAILMVTATLAAAAVPAKQPPKKSVGNVNAKDDARIEEAIKAKLAKSKIGADHFTVRVQGGVATWQGRTSVLQHKGSATRMAKTAGAMAVVNNIQVDESARRKARENLQSGTRRAQIKRSDSRDNR